MNIAVVGKAKTGTTVIQSSIAASSPVPLHVLFEPKSYEDIAEENTSQNNIIVKIIFEHWNKQKISFANTLNNKMDIVFDRLIFIKRDPRDEIVSRLLYVVYPLFEQRRVDIRKFKAWKAVLSEKDGDNSVTFRYICAKFKKIFDIDIEKNVIHHAINDTINYDEFIRSIKTNYFVLFYENFVDNNLSDLARYMEFEIIKHTVDARYDRVRRTSGYGDWKNMMTSSDIEYLKHMAGDDFMRFGYDSWDVSKPPRKSTSYAAYVDRIVGERIRA